MSDIFDVEMSDVASLNGQLLGGKGSETIDVTASHIEDSSSRKFSFRKLTRRQILGIVVVSLVAMAVIAGVVKKQNIETQPNVATSASANVDAILDAPATKPPIPLEAPATLEARAVDIAAPAPVSAVVESPASAVQPSKAQTPVADKADQPKEDITAESPASAVQPLKAQTSVTDEVNLLKRDLAAAKAALKSTAKPVGTFTKMKLKERHELSMSKAGISVLMDDGLIYSSGGDFVELSINQIFPGYGKLVRVDKDARTFETPNHIYFLKD